MKHTPLSVCAFFLLACFLALKASTAHANYWGYNGIVQNQTYQLEFTPLIAQNTTYWATMSASSIGGYGGIQQWNSTNSATDHGGLFSIWDSTSTSLDSFVVGYNPFIGFNNYSFRFGAEGTGAQLLFKWPWTLGKPYRMAWRRYIEPGSSIARYEGFYFDPYDTNALGWVWVGTIRKPVSTDGARNMQGFEGFSEAYGGNTNLVRVIDIRNVWLLNMSNQWQNITAADMTDARDNAILTAIKGGWRHRSYDTNDVFTAVGNLPMFSANDISPIYLPYHINCGGGSTNVAINLQVAASVSRAFEPDSFWYGVSGTNYTANPINVSSVGNAAPSLLYQSRREGTNFGYKFFGQQPAAPSLVRLHFAETDFNLAGARVQNVLINGSLVDTNLDIRALSGAQNRALVRDYIVNADTNGLIDVSFQSQSLGVPAIVSGLEVTGLLPQLATHPQSLTNILGTTAQFDATAVGTPPLSYQWLKGGSTLAGQTNTTLTLTSVTTNDTATYIVVVSNAYGSVTGAVAFLLVNSLSPTITSQPQNQTIYVGGRATFDVAVTGTALLAYQWFRNNVPIPGAITHSYSVFNAQTNQSGNYAVSITNVAGSVMSTNAILTVLQIGNPALTFADIVAGISRIYCGGTPGPIVALATNWVPVAAGDNDTSVPSTFVLARNYFAGRVAVVGHEGVFSDGSIGQLDNSAFAVNLMRWLNGTGQGKIFYSSGHGESFGGGSMNVLGSLLSSNGFALTSASTPLSSTNLALAAVLIIGNAWADFTTNEIEAVRQYVTNGGGLLLAGLGWSWLGYHSGTTLDDYPMTKMAAPYQVRWLDGYITDSTDQISGSPIFHTFYPNISFPKPTITQPKVQNGAFSLLVNGERGRQYRIQSSTNLVNWIDVTNLISANSIWPFVDFSFTNFHQRFYHAVSP